jgi:hypothetical protein
MTDDTARRLREELAEARFQLRVTTWIGAMLFFALVAALAYR